MGNLFAVNDGLVFKIQKYLFFLIPISFIIGQAAVSIIFFSIILSSIFSLNRIVGTLKKYRNYDIVLLFFFIYLLFSSILKDSQVLIDSILLFRFLIFYFIIKYLVVNFSIKDFKIFLTIVLFCSIFVIIDLLYEKYFGFDFFGFGKPTGNELRLTGPFRNEPIPGSYLLNIGFYSFVSVYIFSSEAKTSLVRVLIPILIIIIFGLSIFLTGERISFIMFLFLISLIFIFFIKIRKAVIFSLIFILIGSFIISIKNNYYKERYLNFLNNVGIYKNLEKYHNDSFFDSQWGAHLLTAYKIYSDNNLTGIGIRQFRVICSNQNYEKIKSKSVNIRCSSHPHNLYFEILSETGLIGFFIFVMFLFLISIHFIKTFKSSDKDYIYILSVYTFCVFFMLFWPIRSTGSFFSNFNGSVYWLTISLLSGLLFKQSLKNNNNC
jgi:O-antigen ligase